MRAILHLGIFLAGPRAVANAVRPRRALHHFLLRHPRMSMRRPRLRWLRRRRGWFPDDHERLYPDAPPFFGGVREPRRPKPAPPTDAVALKEPHN
jgi:hypothetical protein